MAVDRGECFGFLGPNGAGKTTTLNVVSGYVMPTSGTVYVRKKDVRTEIDDVHLMSGVCAQENLVWESLTGREHLRFYGRLKSLTGAALEDEVSFRLKQVDLFTAANKKAGEYSGGMKRRLCCACSLIGSPKVIVPDEPSTGLDPKARRDLWAVLKTASKTSSMLLTTHSMEEAENLCTRIGIFTCGDLQCLGTPTDLKSRMGDGFLVSLTTGADEEAVAEEFMKEAVGESNAHRLNHLNGISNYEVKKNSMELSTLLSKMVNDAPKSKINDWGVSNATLEQVFIRMTEEDTTI